MNKSPHPIKSTILTLTLVSCGLFLAQISLAQAPPLTEATAQAAGLPVLAASGLVGFVTKTINVILGFIGVLAVILIVLAGFKWMTSAGNEEQIRDAKRLLRNAVIGLAIVLSAYIITSFVVRSLSMASRQGGSVQCVGLGALCGPNTPTNAQCCAGLVCPNVGAGPAPVCAPPTTP